MNRTRNIDSEDQKEFEKAVREGLISLSLKIPTNVEEEFVRAINEQSKKLTLEDVRIYIGVAFKTFLAKATMIEMIVSLFVLVAYNLLSPYIPPIMSYWLFIVFIILLITLIISVIIRANAGLLSMAKNLGAINALYKFKQKRRDAQLLAFSSEAKTLKEIFEANAYLYGVAFDSIKVKATINSRGGADFHHEMHINATRHGVQSIERFTNVFFDPYNEPTLPILPEMKYDLSDGQTVFLTPEILSSQPKKIEWLLTANPEYPVDVPLPYVYKTKITGQAFSMTTFDLEKSGNQLEWFSQHISYPTKRLIVQVDFPQGYVPKNAGVAVWNTPNVKHLNKIEHDRLLSNQSSKVYEKDGIVSLVLQVEYPITGVHYVITWMPIFDWDYQSQNR